MITTINADLEEVEETLMIAATGQGLTAEVLIEEALGAAAEDPVVEVA